MTVKGKLEEIRQASEDLATALAAKDLTEHAAAAQAIYGMSVQGLSALGDALTAATAMRDSLEYET